MEYLGRTLQRFVLPQRSPARDTLDREEDGCVGEDCVEDAHTLVFFGFLLHNRAIIHSHIDEAMLRICL